jgi:hypothetical protein
VRVLMHVVLLACAIAQQVRLPTGQAIDRPTILQHLLNNPHDPFTRKPVRVLLCVSSRMCKTCYRSCRSTSSSPTRRSR